MPTERRPKRIVLWAEVPVELTGADIVEATKDAMGELDFWRVTDVMVEDGPA